MELSDSTSRWRWEDLCGPEGLKIWSQDTHDLGICFQELCLQIPAMVILAVVSAYYFGNQLQSVSRGFYQLRAINIRCGIVALLTLTPVLQVYIVLINNDVDKYPIFYFISVVQGLTWLTHLGYNLTLRNKLGLSARGPVFVCFVWTIIAVLNVIMVRSRSLIYRAADKPNYGLSLCYGFSILTVVLHSLYALTLIPNDGDTVCVQHQRIRRVPTHIVFSQPNESQPLLPGNAYLRFVEERDPNYLGIAMEDATWLSKLLFYWVNPLMRKGMEEKLRNADDLFDLPDSLRSDTLSRKLERALSGHNDDIHSRKRSTIRRLGAYSSVFSQRVAKISVPGQTARDRTRIYCTHVDAIYLFSGYGSLSHGSSGYESVPVDEDVCVVDPSRRNVSLFRALHRCFGLQFYAVGLLKLTADCAGFTGPMLLNKLVKFIEDKSEDIRYGYAYAAGLFLITLVEFRDSELKYLKWRKYLDALCVYFWATTPVLISILTFLTYIALGNQLTAATVFTSIALLNMLIAPLNAFPWVLNGIAEAWVSLKRIQKLLDLPDMDPDSYYNQNLADTPNLDVVVKHGEFTWDKALTTEEKQKLHAIRKKSFKDRGMGKRSINNSDSSPENEADQSHEFSLSIMGTVGSGKSSIFSAILAEVTKTDGEIAVSDLNTGFAVVTQQPWLQRGTIKDNILFGKNYDESKYVEVLTACCLTEDLEQLPGGDLTGVGEGGMTLSGGQKARIALARAIYQDKQIYLLDDIISAVDANVARQIFQNCIMGILRHKTRILCTHHVRYLMYADRILVMENGTISQQGKPCDVLRSVDDALPVDLELNESISSYTTLDSIKLEDTSTNDDLLNEEARETGTVHINVYTSYWKAIGHTLSLSILLSITIMQFSRNMTDWWLSRWVTNSQNGNTTNISYFHDQQMHAEENYSNSGDMKYYMIVYILLACLNSVFTLMRAFLFALGGITAAAIIHKSLLKSIMKAKITFFDISPLGRILNRFSSDTYTIDDSLPFILNILLAQFFGLLGSVVITIYGLPWLCMVLVPLIPVYHWLQNSYRLTSRELKRLSSVTLSPIYSHFNETLQGLAIIRAFRTTARFKRDNEQNVEENQKTQLASQAASQWLGLRLQFIGVAMVTGVVLIAVIQHQFDVADPGLVGLAITYALSITGLLNGVVNAFTETEREMIAVERVNQYIEEVQSESTSLVTDPPYGWPSQGVIVFEDVVLNYRSRLSCIPQDPFLFSGTIRENLDPLDEYREPEIWSAINNANLIATVRRMGGLDAEVSSGGANFSAGQKQLLCLARALLHNAKILCIDEATANIDQATDRQIQCTLRSAFRKSTVITIAHRVQTVVDYDRVLVMGDGNVLEFDKPDLLLDDPSSHFYRLVHSE
ncbi:atp-binding cassette sub-family c [Holotrichia oblita]|uniref:Atp-binding cassette sub-family c n=1 Tax=Holotrichia oblita TaxID=644536 RepID=A0ACB9T9X5_HOLOL|nr:atp-binding cassette sub-family c [Holotrichia oblita]